MHYLLITNRFGILNGYSALFLYDTWVFQLYNIFFASLPIVIYCLIDKEFNASKLIGNPSYYTQGIKSKFN